MSKYKRQKGVIHLSLKHGIAAEIEFYLEKILGYKTYDPSDPEKSTEEKKRASEDGINADFFDCENDISYLQKAITRAIKTLNVSEKEKQNLISLVKDLQTLPFVQVAEYWLLITRLLYIASNK